VSVPGLIHRYRDPLLRYVVPTLRRSGLLVPTWRLYERVAGLTARGPSVDEHGLPIPPAYLRMLVIGLTSPQYFLTSGRAAAERIRELFLEAGLVLDECAAVLDFGCGCGRIARWWPENARTDWYGCDINPRLVAWCDENLPQLRASVNPLEPPMAYPDGRFDAIYALSVFTHWSEPLQHAWMRELRRMLRPGGRLLFTTHAEATTREVLRDEELASYERGEFVARFSEDAGSNLCSAHHPRAWVQQRLLAGADVLVHRPGGLEHQDVWIVSPRHASP